MELQCFLQVRDSLLLGLALTGDIGFEALRDIPISFSPDGCGEWSIHVFVVRVGWLWSARAGLNFGNGSLTYRRLVLHFGLRSIVAQELDN
jgi:hypothetical protein